MNQEEFMDTVVSAEIDDHCRVVALVGRCKASDFRKRE